MTGGADADTFVFALGQDVITDFRPGREVVDLTGVDGLDDFADVEDAWVQSGGDVVLVFGGDTLTLRDVEAVDLDADNFLI